MPRKDARLRPKRKGTRQSQRNKESKCECFKFSSFCCCGEMTHSDRSVILVMNRTVLQPLRKPFINDVCPRIDRLCLSQVTKTVGVEW